jgi:hypothetical protein
METALVTLGIVGGVAAIGGVLRWYWQMYRDFCGPNPDAPGPGKAKRLANATTISGPRPARGAASSVNEDDLTDTHASTPPTPAIRKDQGDHSGSNNNKPWRMGWESGRAEDVECTNDDDMEVGPTVKGTIVSSKGPSPQGHVRTLSNASTVKMSSRSNRTDPNSDGFSGHPQDPLLATVLDRDNNNTHRIAAAIADKDEDDVDGYDAHLLERWKKRAALRFNSMAVLSGRPRHDSPMAGDDSGTRLPTLDEGGVPTSPVRVGRHDASADPYYARPLVDSGPQRRSLRGIDRWVSRLADDVGGVLLGGCHFESKADRRLGIGPPVLDSDGTPVGSLPQNAAVDPRIRLVVATRLFSEGSDKEEAGTGDGEDNETRVDGDPDPDAGGGGRLGIGPFRRC